MYKHYPSIEVLVFCIYKKRVVQLAVHTYKLYNLHPYKLYIYNIHI